MSGCIFIAQVTRGAQKGPSYSPLTLDKYYNEPVTKPPIESERKSGKPSDHLIVLYEPKQSSCESRPRQFKSVEYRPMLDSLVAKFGSWLVTQNWGPIYHVKDVNVKANFFQNTLM